MTPVRTEVFQRNAVFLSDLPESGNSLAFWCHCIAALTASHN